MWPVEALPLVLALLRAVVLVLPIGIETPTSTVLITTLPLFSFFVGAISLVGSAFDWRGLGVCSGWFSIFSVVLLFVLFCFLGSGIVTFLAIFGRAMKGESPTCRRLPLSSLSRRYQ